MNISFDLDSTLIPNGDEFETEKRNFLGKILGVEKIRKGAPELIRLLQTDGHLINIYTTSFRSKRKIRNTLRYYKIEVTRIVNQTENEKVLKLNKINASKCPKLFNFDLHIDDSKGVGLEGEKFNFTTIIVSPSNLNWTKYIENEVDRIIFK